MTVSLLSVSGNFVQVEIDLTWEGVFTNRIQKNKYNVFNLLALIAKQYIFACKCTKITPSYKMLFRKIIEFQSIENYNADTDKKQQNHVKKWKILFPHL